MPPKKSTPSVETVRGKTPVGACVVLLSVNTIYLIRRKGSHGAGTWSVPGGWIEQDETASDAAKRELLEETGTDAELHWLGYTDDQHPEGWTGITLWFVALGWTKEPQIMEPEKIAEAGWFPLEFLPEPLFAPLAGAVGKLL